MLYQRKQLPAKFAFRYSFGVSNKFYREWEGNNYEKQNIFLQATSKNLLESYQATKFQYPINKDIMYYCFQPVYGDYIFHYWFEIDESVFENILKESKKEYEEEHK